MASAENGSRYGLPKVTVRLLPETLIVPPGVRLPRPGRVITSRVAEPDENSSVTSSTKFTDGRTSS